MEAVECGAASLAMVLGYFGRHIPLEQLRVDCGISRDGSKANNILRAARLHGLEGKGFQRDVKGLESLELPMILFWEFNHFVVLEGITPKHYVINDPAYGRRFISPEDFTKSFTGIALTFTKTSSFVEQKRKNSMWNLFLPQLFQARTLLFFVAIAT